MAPTITETTPLDDAARAAIGAARLRTRALLLLIYHRDGIEAVPLQPNDAVVIGRDGRVTHRIADESLSRPHARFTRIEGKVVVEDLASKNGTWVGGKRVERCELEAGDEILLGGVPVCLHAPPWGERDAHGVESHERFVSRLEDEVERAHFLRHRVALMMVRPARGDGAARRRWYPELRACLRPVDRVGLYSDDTVELLAPELAPDEVMGLAAAIARSGDARAVGLRVGVALFPESGKQAEQILEACRAALQRTTAEAPIVTASAGLFSVDLEAATERGGEAPIVQSDAMREIFEQVDRLARTRVTVLLQGETGTGKEVVARAIHERGARNGRPLVYVNCGAIPESLVESTLFGHEKGAYTGASQRQKGVFEAADGGTLVLDEIGEMPASAQVALLRVLEDRRVRRVGGSEEIEVDVRVVAATHRDLEAMCQEGRFRDDLLYRLSVMTLLIPPLRERAADIEPLARRFLQRAAEDHGARALPLSPGALTALRAYRWPGNIRELRNVVERAAIVARSAVIDVADLPPKLRVHYAPPDAPSAPSTLAVSAGDRVDLKGRLRDLERDLILEALRASEDDITEAAPRLGIPERTLRHRMKLLGIKKAGYGRSV